MKLSLCPQPLYPRGLDGALACARELGFEALELPVDARSPLVDLRAALDGGARALRAAFARHGLAISALSNHQEGQLLLGPHAADTDAIHAGDATEKQRYARARLLDSARLASELEVGLLVGFTGCADWSRFFPWPDPGAFERELARCADELGPLLAEFGKLGVRLALEPHPKQVVYDIDTARALLAALGEPAGLGFNLDPANLHLCGIDPVAFVAELGARVWHVHAKDAELVAHLRGRSGWTAHGPWDRPGRGVRFRVAGWGDLDWKRLISALQMADYAGWLAVENEDPVFERIDGLHKALEHLRPLLPRAPRPRGEARWW